MRAITIVSDTWGKTREGKGERPAGWVNNYTEHQRWSTYTRRFLNCKTYVSRYRNYAFHVSDTEHKKTQNINIKENDDKYHRRKITNKYKPYNTDNKDNQIIIVRIRTVYYTRFEENEASKQWHRSSSPYRIREKRQTAINSWRAWINKWKGLQENPLADSNFAEMDVRYLVGTVFFIIIVLVYRL